MKLHINKETRSELTLFLLQLALFLIPLGIFVPLFLDPGFFDILIAFAHLDPLPYLANLLGKNHGLWCAFTVLGGGALFLGLLRMILHKPVAKYCKTPTTLLAIALGTCLSGTVYCAITFFIGVITEDDLSRHPLQIAWGIALVLLFALCTAALLIRYGAVRLKDHALPALLLDALTAIITVPSVFCFGFVCFSILSDLAVFFEW